MFGIMETAHVQVSVGMGLLAGFTVMLLTVIWGTCIVVGKCDIEDFVAIDGKDTKWLSLTGSGVTTDIWTSYAAMIMAKSLIPFIVVQLPHILHSTSGRHLAVLIALIISVLLLISYCLYQIIFLCKVCFPRVIVVFIDVANYWTDAEALSFSYIGKLV
ncbi:sodium/calcium exchanger NCL-like isoform X2 [Apium graveolens]|uniref:sodium/calcium exchanger NCL-like isoform X2 n=1 Tax=Apium graveolens TaxID=4045 RepID=UPI003D7929FC